MSGELHASATLSLRKKALVPIKQNAGRVPETMWARWRTENPCPYRESKLGCPSEVQSYTG
jgi:hypothetical protein